MGRPNQPEQLALELPRTPERIRAAAAAPALTEPLLDTEEAARLLKVPRSTLYELVRSRGLPHVRVGRGLRFVREDLGRWVAENTYEGRRGPATTTRAR